MPPPVKLASAKMVLGSGIERYYDQNNPTVLGPLPADTDIPVAEHAPSITVFTNIAGAVAVTVDRDSSIGARRRISSKPLPENPFNPFREYQHSSGRRQLTTNLQEKQRASRVDAAAEVPAQNVHVTSAAAAAVAVEGIKKGVRDALDRWALQT